MSTASSRTLVSPSIRKRMPSPADPIGPHPLADPLPEFRRLLSAVLGLVEAGATPARADLGAAVAHLEARLAAALIALAPGIPEAAWAPVPAADRTPVRRKRLVPPSKASASPRPLVSG